MSELRKRFWIEQFSVGTIFSVRFKSKYVIRELSILLGDVFTKESFFK